MRRPEERRSKERLSDEVEVESWRWALSAL
jgi:hypothetical protein